MKRGLTLWLLGLTACAALPGAGWAAASPAEPPREKLTSFMCRKALDPANRAVSVRAVMRPVTGTKRMSMRFELLSRASAAVPFAGIRGSDLGTWMDPTDPPTLGEEPHDVWTVSHPVGNLPAPAEYRFRVTFRWTGAHGKLLASRTRVSATCVQPELRPDLLVQSIVVQPAAGKPNQAQYVATIRNAGATAAGPFQVVFTPGGSTVSKTRTIQRLGPHESRLQTFIGPACTAATAPTVTVDPNHRIDDVNLSNNSLTATCPPAAPGQ
jgi:hypothetical protein